MPDCIYRFTIHGKSTCLREPKHIMPCYPRCCTLALRDVPSPAFRPAHRGRMKFAIEATDERPLRDHGLEIVKRYPHLRIVYVRAQEEEIVRLVQHQHPEILGVSKAVPFSVVGSGRDVCT